MEIRRHKIIGANIEVLSAWEAEIGQDGFSHSSITTIDGRWFGRIGTRRLPDHMEAMTPFSDERAEAVGQWHRQQYQEAYNAIVEKYPEALSGKFSMGEITIKS